MTVDVFFQRNFKASFMLANTRIIAKCCLPYPHVRQNSNFCLLGCRVVSLGRIVSTSRRKTLITVPFSGESDGIIVLGCFFLQTSFNFLTSHFYTI